jgi:hypothetical protein
MCEVCNTHDAQTPAIDCGKGKLVLILGNNKLVSHLPLRPDARYCMSLTKEETGLLLQGAYHVLVSVVEISFLFDRVIHAIFRAFNLSTLHDTK